MLTSILFHSFYSAAFQGENTIISKTYDHNWLLFTVKTAVISHLSNIYNNVHSKADFYLQQSIFTLWYNMFYSHLTSCVTKYSLPRTAHYSLWAKWADRTPQWQIKSWRGNFQNFPRCDGELTPHHRHSLATGRFLSQQRGPAESRDWLLKEVRGRQLPFPFLHSS